MNAPKYRWRCQRCGAGNDAGLDVCAACGCKAIVSAEEIDPTPARNSESINWALMFPEVFIAAGLALAAPFLAVSLAVHGRPIAAILLLAGIALSGYVCYVGNREKQNWLIHVGIVGALGVGAIVFYGTS